MRVAVYSSKQYERPFLEQAAASAGHELVFFDERLTVRTSALASGFRACAIFANDDGSRPVLAALAAGGVRLLALRSAGFNHVDIAAAAEYGLTVLRVPAYSPHSVAEHAVALLQTLNRKLHRAYNRVREQNFSLDGLMGFDLAAKTVGVIGTGRIGEVVCRILGPGYGCRVLAFDVVRNRKVEELGGEYVPLDRLFRESDIVTLHCPLTPTTHHLINAGVLATMKQGAIIVNTSRGGVIDTPALIEALKRGALGGVALDVYEEEADLFFKDLSDRPLQDDVFVRLQTFPNVLITAHQGFFTREAVGAIGRTTIENITAFEQGRARADHLVTAALLG